MLGITPGLGLPRPRGDRPSHWPPAPSGRWSPPPTRGSTEGAIHHSSSQTVSPAHAGIDRVSGTPSCGASGLPRPRGDRPKGEGDKPSPSPSPPPTRGSTLVLGGLMSAPLGLPRPRGDRPYKKQLDAIASTCLPRPRGDRPAGPALRGLMSWSPPPTRGSTQCARKKERRGDVSPAHAGIDPRATGRRSEAVSLPRPRGDRPSTALG